MSNSLISRNSDLSDIEAKYRVRILGAYLIVEGIFYLGEDGEPKQAEIVTHLDMSGGSGEEVIKPPKDHTVWWTGEMPYRATGESMEADLVCNKWSEGKDIEEGITVYTRWSRKLKHAGKTRKYSSHYEKIEAYILEVSGEVEISHPGILEAAKFVPGSQIDMNTRFVYIDTNSYRNGTRAIEKRIDEEIVAVIGVGGTGSYLVDILAKTNIKELHLYDDDVMDNHNAFRVAGAARVSELNGMTHKVDWHRKRYQEVRKDGLHIHQIKINETNYECLKKFTTIFIVVDDLKIRRKIQKVCQDMGIHHISVGLGLDIEGENDDQIGGNVKIEVDYIPKNYDKFNNKSEEEQYENPADLDVYESNIQTAELNMLGAALAITEWKAHRQIYRNERDRQVDSIIYSSTTGKIQVAQKGG